MEIASRDMETMKMKPRDLLKAAAAAPDAIGRRRVLADDPACLYGYT